MKPKNYILMEQIQHYHNLGWTDQKIARELKYRGNVIHYYRHFVLKLPANQPKMSYDSLNDKLKGYILRGIKCSAKRRNISFNLKYYDLTLPTHCPVLGIELQYKSFENKSQSNDLNFATVDRIDNKRGYVKDNVWIISRLANNMKNCADLDTLEVFANNILKTIKNQRALGDITDSVES